jgi:hypothetical protein
LTVHGDFCKIIDDAGGKNIISRFNWKSWLTPSKGNIFYEEDRDMYAPLDLKTNQSHHLTGIVFKGLLCLLLTAGIVAADYTPSNKIFTYQGRLYDGGIPADGEYDLMFRLLDGPDPNEAKAVTWEEVYNEHSVSNGFLTVDLNFAPYGQFSQDDLFDGSDRWLRIGIRPCELEDPNEYTFIYPLTKLNAVPFAHLAHRLRTPAELRSDTNESVLTIANAGAGPEINFEGESTLVKYGNDATIDIVDDYLVNIGNSQTRFVGYDSTEEIGHDRTITINQSESKTIGVNSQSIVTLNRSATVGAADQTIVGAISTVSAGGDLNRSAGKDLNLQAGRNIKLTADNEIQTLSLMRITGADPNQAVLVDGVLSLKSKQDFPPVNGTYGMLYVREGKLYYQDDDDLFLITSGGATPQQICFSVKRDAAYDWPVNNTPQLIDFGKDSTIWYSVGGGFDQKSSSFIAPTRGIYSFSGSIHFRNLSGNDQIYAELKCGPRTYRGDYQFVRGYAESATVNVTTYLEAGDVVQLWGFVWAISPPVEVFGNAITTHAFTYFNGAKVN